MPNIVDIYFHIFDNRNENQINLVLLHGAGGNHLFWPVNIRRLPGCRVFALDLPGHGKSGGSGFQTIHHYAKAIANWMERINLNKTYVIGHSMGSAIAMVLALRNPQSVAGLGLIGSAGRFIVSPMLLETTKNPTTAHRAIQLIVQWSFTPNTPKILIEAANKWMSIVRPSVLHGDFLACSRFDVSDQLPHISCPTLIICGELDKMTPIRQSRSLHQNITNSSLHLVPNAGHMVMLEQSKIVADSIEKFIHNNPF